MRLCDLKQMEVINECDCKRLGFVDDVEFDLCTGCIKALIVPGEPKLCGMFGRDSEYIIPFPCVVQIGKDIILVKAELEEVRKKCKM